MPRQSRLYAPGVLHHVIIRGIERKRIFTLSRKSRVFESRSVFCYLYVRELGESMKTIERILVNQGR
jgi:hypothetical protein